MEKIVDCTCGCKNKLNPIDSWGKNRKYIIGHHPHSRAKKVINNEKEILEIKEKITLGIEQRLIALEYGVSKTTIYDIKNKRSWRNLCI